MQSGGARGLELRTAGLWKPISKGRRHLLDLLGVSVSYEYGDGVNVDDVQALDGVRCDVQQTMTVLRERERERRHDLSTTSGVIHTYMSIFRIIDTSFIRLFTYVLH